MSEETIRTDVDRLIEILKSEKKMELKLLAKKLDLPEETIQQWIDFLVEEKIVTIDYDFTKPIVSIVEEKEKEEEYEKEDFLKYKEKFKNHAKKGSAEYIWRNHLLENLEQMKHFFFTEARKRELEKIPELWEEYKKKVAEL